MQVVVLAGGRGQRLDPLTVHRPKPLVPVLGRPLLGRLLEELASQPVVDEIVVTTGYLGRMVEDYIRLLALRVPVRVVHEDRPRGTAGAVAELASGLRSPFAVVSGDVMAEIDLGELLAAHLESGAAATISVTDLQGRLRFGVVDLRGGSVEGFREKPYVCDLVPSGGLNTGCYVLEARALRGFAGDGATDFAHDVFPRLLRQGLGIAAATATRYWRDLGTLESYRDMHLDAVSEGAPEALPISPRQWDALRGVRAQGAVHLGCGTHVEPGAELVGPLYVGDACHIGAGAHVERSVLLDGCRVGPGGWVTGSVVDTGAAVADNCAVSGAIVSRTTGRPGTGSGIAGDAAGPAAAVGEAAGPAGAVQRHLSTLAPRGPRGSGQPGDDANQPSEGMAPRPDDDAAFPSEEAAHLGVR